MGKALAVIGALGVAMGLSAPAPAGDDVLFFTDPVEFDTLLQGANKFGKAFWSFKPDNQLPDTIVPADDVLDIDTHPLNAPGIWDNPDGTTLWPPELDNVQFSSNLNPQGAYAPRGFEGLFYASAGFHGLNNNVLGANFTSDSFSILSGLPAGDNHTAMALEIIQVPGFDSPPPVFHVTVYDTEDVELGKFIMDGQFNTKLFLGILVQGDATIGRVDVWDESDGVEGISSIAVYVHQEPVCPWDCALEGNADVGINDFLALIAQWGEPGPCDFDGGGVDINDFLKLIAHWGPCPAPPHDECSTAIQITRLDDSSATVVHFDMYGATASPEPYLCSVDPPTHPDVWYQLHNAGLDKKLVTVRSQVDLLLEVTQGAACPPLELVACGMGPDGTPQFPMQPREMVTIRLVNVLDLPPGMLKGDLIIENKPFEPPDPINFFTDSTAFFDAVAAAGKVEKFTWDFTPHDLAPASIAVMDDVSAIPLDIDTHGNDADDPWTDAAGLNLWPDFVNNVQFAANNTPQQPLDMDLSLGLAFATAGFVDELTNDALLANEFGDSFTVVSGAPVGDNHTAMWFDALSLAGGEQVILHVTVFDKQNKEIGKALFQGLPGEKVFIGILAKDGVTIGQVDIWDELSGAEGVSQLAAYLAVK